MMTARPPRRHRPESRMRKPEKPCREVGVSNRRTWKDRIVESMGEVQVYDNGAS
jgi:hypothetical protein